MSRFYAYRFYAMPGDVELLLLCMSCYEPISDDALEEFILFVSELYPQHPYESIYYKKSEPT